MKDSGVEWLGDIPEHWDVIPVKHVSSIFVPQRNKPELNQDDGFPWITMDDITSHSVENSGTPAVLVILLWLAYHSVHKYPFPQQTETCAAIHLAFDELQSIHLSLSLPITPW
jgi:hypothetical protein